MASALQLQAAALPAGPRPARGTGTQRGDTGLKQRGGGGGGGGATRHWAEGRSNAGMRGCRWLSGGEGRGPPPWGGGNTVEKCLRPSSDPHGMAAVGAPWGFRREGVGW